MIAMILAAGVGTRLSPLTLFMPKPMVPICNKPVMEHIIDLLAQHEIKTVVANLHYLPDQIERYFGNGQRWGVNLTYSLEKDLLGTAGAVKRVADIFEESFFVLMGDAITDLDLTDMMKFHRQNKAKVTLALHPIEDPSCFGVVQVDKKGRILGFQDRPKAGEERSNLANMGVYIVEPEILDLIPANNAFDFEHQLFPQLLEKEVLLYGYRSECFWSDVGNFSEYRAAQTAMLQGKITTAIVPGRRVAENHWQGRNVNIHANARLVPPVLIGDHCQIEDNAIIGPNSVIGNNVIVAEGATISNSTILNGTYVGKLVNVQDAVVNRNCLVNVPSNTSVYVADNFLLGEVGEGVVIQGLGRAFEWIAGLVLFILSIPIWMVGFVAGLFAGKGPLIEKEVRTTRNPGMLGENGRIPWKAVTTYRFRADPATKAGRWLERTSVRDLPGLLAVLNGNLALVGTGPLSPERIDDLTEEWQRQRFMAPAGVTGLWYNNSINYAEKKMPFEEQLIVDSYYAVTRNGKEDLKIFIKTLGVWIKRIINPR
ncbi:MAG: sugar phosphate nucleotidyltransferase [Chloroflexi bacterium]|nr:sugar phosphate nucleotidyltransferase [Chloroflexota bacterium]